LVLLYRPCDGGILTAGCRSSTVRGTKNQRIDAGTRTPDERRGRMPSTVASPTPGRRAGSGAVRAWPDRLGEGRAQALTGSSEAGRPGRRRDPGPRARHRIVGAKAAQGRPGQVGRVRSAGSGRPGQGGAKHLAARTPTPSAVSGQRSARSRGERPV